MTAVKSFRETLLCGADVGAIKHAELATHMLDEMRIWKRQQIFKDAGVDVAGAVLKQYGIEDPGK